MPFDRGLIRNQTLELAQSGVFVGTSSWKYAGWRGMLYDEQRYIWRGRFAESRFEKNCLREYAEVFKTVCVDAAYYTFPSVAYLEDLVAQVPADFQFGFKITDAITLKRFMHLPRFGVRAGKPNENFLNAELFMTAFLEPCQAIRRNVGVLIFEFSKFYPSDYEHGRDFIADLDQFLGRLPRGWPYAVELRNPAWLQPDYFACLAQHEVTHVFNSWEATLPVAQQMDLPGSRTHPRLVAARFLLKPGRKYEEAVKAFQPYDRIQEANPEVRAAGKALIAEGKAAGAERKTFIYVNNRLEGNALETIRAIIQADPV